jgi:hypothetical protein
MKDDIKQMTRDQIIEALTENKRHDLENGIDGQVEDYEMDLDGMNDDEIVKEYENAFHTKVEIVATAEE